MTRSELIEKVKLLPYSPGVYLMKDKKGKIIYVGKSKSLRNRVGSYFKDPSYHNIKTSKLVSFIDDFSCVYTDSETEALILENELIKKHAPKYNIKLKDSKNYPYVKITDSDYPGIVLGRTRRNDKSKYFGPYTSSKAVYDIIDTVNRTFKTASCGRKFEYGKEVCRPCLNYHIGKCIAPCTGKISKEEYRSVISEVQDFLNGDYEKVKESLTSKMYKASQEMKFEIAAQFRDRIAAIDKLSENQKIISDLKADKDIFGIYEGETLCVISILFIRSGKLIDKELIYFSSDELTDEHALSDLVLRYYSDHEYIPKTVLLSFGITDEDYETLGEFVSNKAQRKVEIKTPIKGAAKELVNLASENARQAVEQYSKEQGRGMKILTRLYEYLGLDSIPLRIESYDISNNGKENMYAGMIVVENGVLKKKDYRSFSIKTVEGTDDYAAMTEALDRRLARLRDSLDGNGESFDSSFSAMPDLILLDGGAGHVNAILPLLEKYNLPINVFGMIKDSFHKTRILTDGKNEISIAHVQDIFTFIYGVQEEVHRYSFSKMDSSRRKNVKHSTLEKIEGIGPSKSKGLIKHFGNIISVKNASIEELEKVNGINNKTATNIYNYFHGNKK